MAETMPTRSGEGDRLGWLPWSVFPFQSRFAEVAGQTPAFWTASLMPSTRKTSRSRLPPARRQS